LGLARRDVVPGDAALIGPRQNGVADVFGGVVADHRLGLGSFENCIEPADNEILIPKLERVDRDSSQANRPKNEVYMTIQQF
jgi:hypothetical protein